jgi:methylated-DNA-[protein]-cysteine S-methyltransferase
MEVQELSRHYHAPMVGWLELRVSQRGVRSVSFVAPPAEADTCPSHSVMAQLVDELDKYFRRELTRFSVPLDPRTGTTFQRRVWEELSRIPYGQTRSYAQIAEALGAPRAARAVGSANGSNPIAIAVPCHRVIKADGSIGGYSSGTDIKRVLLEWEGVHMR